MISFIRKNSKKIFIIFSSFIIFYSFFFVQVHDVNAYAISSPESAISDIRYINGVKHLGVPDGNAQLIVDLPTTSSSFFSVYPLSYTISALGYTLSFNQEFYSATDLDITSFTYPNSIGAFSFLIDSFLCSDANSQDVDILSLLISTELNTTDTLYYQVYFNYYVYDEYSSSLSLLSYQDSGSHFGNYPVLAPFQDFIDSVNLGYDYYFLRDIVFIIWTDSSDSSVYKITSNTSDVPDYYTLNTFIELNDFSLGVSQEELDDAYYNGFIDGVDSVDTQEFYNQGYTNASQDFLKFENLIFGVMNGFTNTISQLFDFQIFGISVFGLVGGLVAIAFAVGIIILIIKVIKIFT